MKAKSLIYMLLFLMISIYPVVKNGEERKFEFLNKKSKSSVWIRFGYSADPDSPVYWVPTHINLERVQANKRISSRDPIDLFLLSYRDQPQRAEDVRLYAFALGKPGEKQKDVFVQVKDTKNNLMAFGLQTSPLGGLGGIIKGHAHGISASGFPLRNNIAKEGIIPLIYYGLPFDDPIFQAVTERDSQAFLQEVARQANINDPYTIDILDARVMHKLQKIATKKLNWDGWSILHQAVLAPQKDILINLMKMGADPDQSDASGLTPRQLAQRLFAFEPEENINRRVQYIAIQKLFELFKRKPQTTTEIAQSEWNNLITRFTARLKGGEKQEGFDPHWTEEIEIEF